MPIGLVSQYDMERELASFGANKSLKKVQIDKPEVLELPAKVEDKPTRGRKEGDVNVPDSLRKVIGETAVIEGRQAALNLAKDFDISPSSVSAYAKGATSTSSYDTPAQSIISHINKSRQRAIKKAANTLNLALGSITQEKLDYADVKDLSGIAKDMSVIIRNLEPQKDETPTGDVKAPQFVIFAPQFRDERSFETIQVQE